METVDKFCTLPSDVAVISDARHGTNLTRLLTELKGKSIVGHKERLYINYKEPSGTQAGRGRFLSQETMCLTSASNIVTALFNISVPRLFYCLSSCASNSIVQVDSPEASPQTMVTRSQKELVLGSQNLSRRELDAAPDAQMVLFHHEKNQKLLCELIRQTSAGVVVTPTAGSGPIIDACLSMHVCGVLLARSSTHRELLNAHALKQIRAACDNPESRFHLSRSAVIEKLGLSPDAGTERPEDDDDEQIEVDLDEAEPIATSTSLPAPSASAVLPPPVPALAGEPLHRTDELTYATSSQPFEEEDALASYSQVDPGSADADLMDPLGAAANLFQALEPSQEPTPVAAQPAAAQRVGEVPAKPFVVPSVAGESLVKRKRRSKDEVALDKAAKQQRSEARAAKKALAA